MKTTIVYVDGYNLYYGLLKGTKAKWLDLVAFSRALLRPDHDIVKVRYFTAPVKTYPYDAPAIERQNTYLQALGSLPEVEISLGFYSKNPTLLPAYEDRCKICDVPNNGLVRVVKLEEKRSDVNIATSMLMDAFNQRAESFVLVSGDTDFIGPVTIVRKDFKKNVIVLNPHSRRSDLAKYASFYKDIPRELPLHCQLPDAVPVGLHGRIIHRPDAWR